MTLSPQVLEGCVLHYMVDECSRSLCSVFLSHSSLSSKKQSNEGSVKEIMGPFAAKLGERGPHRLGGKEASSRNAGQPPAVGRQGQENAKGLSGPGKGLFGPGKGFWDELQMTFLRFPCSSGLHDIRAVCF